MSSRLSSPLSLSTSRPLLGWLLGTAVLWGVFSGTIVTAQDAVKANTTQKEKVKLGPAKRILIHRRYLRIPVCETSKLKSLSVTTHDGEEVTHMEVKLAGANDRVSSWVELDVSRWIGGEMIMQLAEDAPQKILTQVRQSNSSINAGSRQKKGSEQPATFFHPQRHRRVRVKETNAEQPSPEP